ncbi:heavy metal translocating P-type ATPase [Nocardia sp. NPDC005978]|uniref:heavy metal translocating P-type ATPase n=1 Tax=Nocardia sp. NPDC005978 TaxID=3156725 RepID=UPI0033AB2252
MAPTVVPSEFAPSAAPVRRTRPFDLTETRWAAAALGLFVIGLGAQLAGAPEWMWWACYLGCYAAGGWEPGLAGLRALRERTLDVDLLMVVAALGAAAIGQVTDGALLIVIFATSGALEAFATARTEDSVRGLLDLAPDTATRLDPAGAERVVQAADLVVGDVLLVRPGERIPADGTVIGGGSEVDQATITGESMPVPKTAGDEVFAGTLNGTGALRVRVDRRAAEWVVARIATLVQDAGRTKARTQLFIEKVEQRYSVGMVAATLLLFAIPLICGDTLQRALLRAMTFMIVASPCAVVLATMPPLLAAMANAGRHGVLVKSAVVMEQLGAVSRIAFDKTGTLTRGTPELAEIHRLETRFDEDELLRLAAAAERPSEHPLAAAIVRAADARKLPAPIADDFLATPGQGVSALVEGHRVAVTAPGAPRVAEDCTTETIRRLEAGGRTAVIVTRDGTPVGVLALTDRVRPEARRTVAAARRLTAADPILLTGDNHRAATLLAGAVGITDVRANLLPADKAAAIHALQAGGERVAMVGDGINDAPALATATVGIAMNSPAADLTLHTADAILIHEDLTAVPAVIALSRRARRVVIANLTIAATCIAALVIWDLAGTLPLPLGVAGHEGSTLLVALNGLRLLRDSAWQRAAEER